MREPEVLSISARGKITAQLRIEDAQKTMHRDEKKIPQTTRNRVDKVDFQQTTPVLVKREEEKEKSSSAARTRSSKKLCERNRNHLRRKIMAKANELIVKKENLAPHMVEADKIRESSATIKLKRSSLNMRSGIAPSVKTRPSASYLTPVNQT